MGSKALEVAAVEPVIDLCRAAAGEPAVTHAEVVPAREPDADPASLWVRYAEDFVATQALLFIGQYFVQLRGLLVAAVIGAILLLVAVTCYPFQPQYLLTLIVLAIAGGVAAGTIFVLVDINRNELVSRVTRTTPNRFTPDLTFLSSFFLYVVPILLALAVQFPSVSGWLRGLFEPVFRGLP